MKKLLLSFLCITCIVLRLYSQNLNPVLIGYWHNWSTTTPYIQLDQIDSRYNIIEIAFAVPTSTSDMTMIFTPDVITQQTFINKVNLIKSQGKKVLISIGGATTSIDLTTSTNKTAFINSMINIINTFGFDGIDIDIENGNSILINNGGTISNPANPAMINLIDAIKQIMTNYRTNHPGKLMLTMAPETAYVQGGQSGFGSIWGGYLPIIHALRDSIDFLQVQLYNSGSMYGVDGNIYTQGTADFIVAMTEVVIKGFNTNGGYFTGLPASKVAVGLPACPSAAGGGFVDTNTVMAAIKYLIGIGTKPGSYTLNQISGYPNLAGLMTWSINWDALSTCESSYQFARNFQNIFGSTTECKTLNSNQANFQVFPNPAKNQLLIKFKSQNNSKIQIYNSAGFMVIEKIINSKEQNIDISNLIKGIYLIKNEITILKFVKD